MSLSSALIESIKSGFYVNSIGTSVTYKQVLMDMLQYAHDYGYNQAIMQTNIKLSFFEKRISEIQSYINLLTQEMEDDDISDKYAIFIEFIQSNQDTDSTNMPILISANTVLSGRFSSFKNKYHELSVLLYKKTLFEDVLLNLTQNKESINTIISDISSIQL